MPSLLRAMAGAVIGSLRVERERRVPAPYVYSFLFRVPPQQIADGAANLLFKTYYVIAAEPWVLSLFRI